VALPKVSGIETHLAICGRGATDYEEELQRLVSKLGLAERVHFRGMTHGEEKTRVFFQADLCVVPSFTENFGMVVAEALAHGVPVIASRGTPWAELELRDCGLWVDNSPESLAKAITSMSQRNLQDMGRKGRQWMETAFCWQTIADRVSELYMKLIRKQ
jgi:glycosyltransferase involved in cell wall biosynthesis